MNENTIAARLSAVPKRYVINVDMKGLSTAQVSRILCAWKDTIRRITVTRFNPPTSVDYEI